jgi:hypothetical protein
MTCHDARALFSDRMDDALTAEDRAHLDAHLAECADCRKELERFTATVALLHRMERPRAPVAFVDRVLAAARPTPWHRRLLQRLFLPLAVKVPAEAAAVLLVAGLAVYVFQRTPELQQAARQETFTASRRSSPLAQAPPPANAPTEANVEQDALRKEATDARGKVTMQDEAARSVLAKRPQGQLVAPPAPPPPAKPAVERQVRPRVEFRKQAASQGGGAATAPAPPASAVRPHGVEEAAKTATSSPAATGAAAPAPRGQPEFDATKEAKPLSLAAPGAPAPAPSEAPPAPADDVRADSEKGKLARSPARAAPPLPPAARVPPAADVVGRLVVKDRAAAEGALGALLARSGGVVISRRDDAGATLLEVAVPKAAYPAFSQDLARLGAWRPEGEPSELPPLVRVVLRLVE